MYCPLTETPRRNIDMGASRVRRSNIGVLDPELENGFTIRRSFAPIGPPLSVAFAKLAMMFTGDTRFPAANNGKTTDSQPSGEMVALAREP